MRVTLSRQGNSLGLRIPREIAIECGLVEGARVAIRAHGDHIVIAIPRLRYRLEDLLGGMRPEAMHEAFDWGPDAGRESVDGK